MSSLAYFPYNPSGRDVVSALAKYGKPNPGAAMTLDQIRDALRLNERKATDAALRNALDVIGVDPVPGKADAYGIVLRPLDTEDAALADQYEAWRDERRRRADHLNSRAPANVIPIRPDAAPTDGGWISRITGPLFKLSNAGWDEELPPLEYVVDGIIGKGDVALFVAHGNSLKTWIAYDMAIAVASGTPWLGRFPTLPKPGRVLLLDYESGDREVRRRNKLLRGNAPERDVGDRMYRVSYPAGRLHDPKAWAELASGKWDLIVVDSFGRCGDGTADENDKRAAVPLELAGEFCERTGATVIFIHHAGKGEKRDRREKVRGTSAIYANVDWAYEFTDLEKQGGGVIRVTMQTIKDGAGKAPDPVRVQLSDDGLSYVAPKVAPAAAPETPAPDVDVRVMLEVESRGSMAGYREIAKALSVSERQASEAVKLLRERGDLIRGKDRRLYPGDVAAQTRRVHEVIAHSLAEDGIRITTVADLMAKAAATKETVDDLIARGTVTRSAPGIGHFLIVERERGKR